MANALTSIATTGGWSTSTVTAAYDLYFRWALRSQPTMRQFVDVRPQQVTHTGSSVQLQLNNYFASAAVVAAKTPLNEESDPDSVKMPATTTVTLTPNEYGFATIRTLKLKNRAMVDVDPVIATAVAAHAADVIDALIQDVLLASPTYTLFGGTHTSIVTQTATDTFSAALVRKAVLGLRVRQVVPWEGGLYTAVVHPDAIYDLRTETGQGSWRQPNEYGTDQSRIWAGEVGIFEGARFVENPRTLNATDGASSAHVLRSYFFGHEALAEIVVQEPGIVMANYTDAFNRFRRLGWYADLGWSTFRPESLAVVYTGTAL